MCNKSRLLRTSLVLLAALQTGAAPIQRPLQLGTFHSIRAGNGGHVELRYGPAHRVTMVQGSSQYSRVFVNEGGVLVIDRCRAHCPRGYELEVEVLAPSLTRVSLAHGGRIEARGTFPRQRELAVDVNNGGRIDVRSLVADRVTASVEQGGGIMLAAQVSLSASVAQGGIITYWGNARVTSEVEHGGVVTRGEPEERSAPAR